MRIHVQTYQGIMVVVLVDSWYGMVAVAKNKNKKSLRVTIPR
jgi:hypothetical protein